MAAQNDSLATFGQGQNQIFDFATADGVESGGWFVQNDEVGIVDQGLGQANAALHPFGEFPHDPGADLAQTNHVQKLFVSFLALLSGQREKVAKKIERLVGIQKAVKVRFLR